MGDAMAAELSRQVDQLKGQLKRAEQQQQAQRQADAAEAAKLREGVVESERARVREVIGAPSSTTSPYISPYSLAVQPRLHLLRCAEARRPLAAIERLRHLPLHRGGTRGRCEALIG